MSEFANLSREERALYNPAFTAVLTARAVQGHEVQYSQPCPIPVAVLSSVMALQCRQYVTGCPGRPAPD